MSRLARTVFLMCVASVFLVATEATLFAQSPEYAYVTIGNTVTAFSIDQASGALTAIPGSPIQGGGVPVGFQLDPAHRFAYALLPNSPIVSPFSPYSHPPVVSAYTVDLTTGNLTAVPGAPFGVAWTPVYLTVGPHGNRVYVVDFGGDYSNYSPSLLTYSIDDGTGALTLFPGRASLGMPPQDTPGAAIIDPAASFLYMISCPPPGRGEGPCQEPSSLYGFAIGHNRELTPVPGSPYSIGQGFELTMAVTPNSQFLYLSSGAAYAIDGGTGALTPVPGSPFPVAGRGIAIDPQGEFVFLVGCSYQHTCVERIDPVTGALTPVSGSPFYVGGDSSLSVDSTGKFVYMPTCIYYSGSCIAGATVDRNTGALTPIPGSPFPVPGFDTVSPVSIIGAPN